MLYQERSDKVSFSLLLALQLVVAQRGTGAWRGHGGGILEHKEGGERTEWERDRPRRGPFLLCQILYPLGLRRLLPNPTLPWADTGFVESAPAKKH